MRLLSKTVVSMLIFSVCLIPRVGVSASTRIILLPHSSNVELGQIFQVECWIYNVTNLYGLDIQITWNPTALKYLSHVRTIPANTYPSGVLWNPVLPVKDVVDESGSIPGAQPGTRYWLAEASFSTAPAFSGNGMCFTMTFQANAVGNALIGFKSADLSDNLGFPIAFNRIDAEVNVYDLFPPEISSVVYHGTSPYPYWPSGFIRPNEPVTVTANVTDREGVASSTLCYRVNSGAWWNTTMSYNSSTSLYAATIPGQQGSSTVEFSIVASDTFGFTARGSSCLYDVQPLLLGDLDGNGVVSIFDVVICTGHYGQKWP